MTLADLTPLLQLYEMVVLENYALRATLENLPGWNDETVNTNKEKYRPIVSGQFAVLYQLGNNPIALNAALQDILKSKKLN